MNISGKEVIDSIPGNKLLALAITKLFLEGRNRYEIDTMCDLMVWDVHRSLDLNSLPQAIESNEIAQAEGKIITEDMVNGNDCKSGECS